MKHLLNEQTDWRENAVQFLTDNTKALRDSIEHFVDHHWQRDITDDENLEYFQTYQEEYQQAFA